MMMGTTWRRWSDSLVAVALQAVPLLAFFAPPEIGAILNPPFNAVADALATTTGLFIAGEAGQLFLWGCGLGYIYLGLRARWEITLMLGGTIWMMGYLVGLALIPAVFDVPVMQIGGAALAALLVMATMIDVWRVAWRGRTDDSRPEMADTTASPTTR